MAEKSKFYTKKQVIDGVEYTAQYSGMRTAARFVDRVKQKDGTNSFEETADYIFEHVIVEPKVTMDDFDSMETLGKVVAFGVKVMQGKFRDGEDEGADSEAS